MNPVVGLLFLAGVFVLGIWLGWHAAHLDIRMDADLADYLTTGSLPALSFGDSAGQGAARTDPPSAGAGRASPTAPS
ncbi:MAG: hypothetical protein KC491_01065 [Dehalococcoidia bacterium]|nr:hypothetical protein [Dehalococcoidia bacterium]